jgi:hypothetical protein
VTTLGVILAVLNTVQTVALAWIAARYRHDRVRSRRRE